MEEILRCPSCGFQIRGHPTQYFTRRTVVCPMCRAEAPLTEEDRLRLRRLTAEGAAPRADRPPPGPGSPPPRRSPPRTLRRQELVGGGPPQAGAFSPSSRRHPRYTTCLPAWWAERRGAQGLPAETVNISSAGLLLILEEPPTPGSDIHVRVETPFGSVEGGGRIAWIQKTVDNDRAGITLTQLHRHGDRLRWERLIGQLAVQGAHG
ncbi:MAG TPA: PilZ domain-containing protein [Candidatus Methylomirabilis sp.]|nr:PilZ domain-containing protein [Candidatus Methylomirabilis sp.]